jgi:hypothetical protein
MERINAANWVDIGSGRRGFRDRNLAAGQAGTNVAAAWLNGAQEELARAIELSGIALSEANREQLAQAIRRLAASNIASLATNASLTPDHAGVLLVSAASGNVTLTLPPVNSAGGLALRVDIFRTDSSANTLTVQRAGADTVEGANSLVVPPGQLLSLVGDGASVWRRAGGAGRLLGVQIFETAGTATYTPTPGTRSVIVSGVGGGGGGGGAVAAGAGNVAPGFPGSAGAYGRARFWSGFAGVTVTIGAGGAGGTGAAGGNGGNSSFGALLSLPGGPGGTAGAAQVGSASGGNGNLAPPPTGANLEADVGHQGGISFGATGGQIAIGGHGGHSRMGAGGIAGQVNLAGNNASGFGGGGGGTIGVSNTSALTGGAGMRGRIVVEEYS